MIDQVVEYASWALIVAGSAFVLIGAIGLARMPDLFTRMHAASVVETLGAGLLVLGMILQAGFDLVSLKLLFIFALLYFFGPVVTHALAQAALHHGLTPLLHEDRRNRLRKAASEEASEDATDSQEPA